MTARPYRLLGTAMLGLLALLLLAAALLELSAGGPPVDGDVPAWVDDHFSQVAWLDEILVIASVVGAVALFSLWQVLPTRRPAVAVALVIGAVAVPVGVVASALHGRLVYPIGPLDLADDVATARLSLAAYYAAIHVIDLIAAVAAIVLAVGLWRVQGLRAFAVAAGAAGVVLIAHSYLYLFPSWAVFPMSVAVIALIVWLALLVSRGAFEEAPAAA